MLATQLKYELLMFFRELFYMFFTIIIPPATYLFLGQLYGHQIYAGNLSYAETYTPSFILLITFGVIFFSFGFEQVANRTTGVEKRIQVSPVSRNTLLFSSILKSIIITSIGFFLIYLLGIFVYQLAFSPLQLLAAYLFFIILNAILLIMSSAIYGRFNNMNATLIFSIVLFQLVIFTGGFTMPIAMMPKFVQIIAEVNPLYHMNTLFIDIWNGRFLFAQQTLLSIGYLIILVLGSFVMIRFSSKK